MPSAATLAHAAGATPFTLGVASGEPAPDGFVLWTRLALNPLAPDGQGGMAEPVAVTWEVATDETMRNIVRRGTVDADNRLAHSVHIEVGGLKPDRPYWYRFTALGEQSPMGRARTAPAPDARLDLLRFAFAPCSNWQVGYFSAYRHMAEENPDLVLFLGDYIYEFTYGGANVSRVLRPHDGPTAMDLAAYRNRHALYKTDPDLQALHAVAPCLVTWDDHEVENDYADEWSQQIATGPEDFLRRRAAAYQAYYEHMPLRARAVPRSSALRLNERFRFGDLVSFSVTSTPTGLPTSRPTSPTRPPQRSPPSSSARPSPPIPALRPDCGGPPRQPACEVFRESASRIRVPRSSPRPHGDALPGHFRPTRSRGHRFHPEALRRRERQGWCGPAVTHCTPLRVADWRQLPSLDA